MIKNTIKKNLRKNSFTFYLFLLILIVLVSCEPPIKSLPYLGEHEVGAKDTSYYQIPEFSLINQDSVRIDQKIVEDKVYVAYFFFTSCPATCPIMTSAMQRVHKVVGDDPNFEIMAHTIDPARDTPAKLKTFAEDNEIATKNWHLLTEEEAYIYDLGLKGYYLSMGQNDAAPGGYIHSAKFMLIDKNRHIRGVYEGTDAGEVAELIRGIQFLLEEKEK